MSQKNKAQYEFLEEPRSIMGEWYELLEDDYDTDDVLKLTTRDPDFYDPYLVAADDMRELGKIEEARKLEDEAFRRAQARIEDKEGNWPDAMPWEWLENRHVIRALATGADNFWKDGETEKALEVYRKLLRSNLTDNIGARYAIIALRLGYSYDEYIERVWPESTMPADHIAKWFREHMDKFPEELDAWKEYAKREAGLEEKDLM